MEKYIFDLCNIIRNGEMENTYKMVWIRSIVESCVLDPNVSVLHFDDLSKKIFGYYWNQTIFFNLEQSPNPNKRPEIYQIVVDEIRKYKSFTGCKPEWFSRIYNEVDIPLNKISSVLKKDVCWRFKIVGKETLDIYDLDKRKRTITVKRPDLIKIYSDILFDLINYRWTQKLEEFNHAPRISKKVLGTDRERVRRGNLSKFQKYLEMENPDGKCFYTDKILSKENLAIDHVLPWSFMYSDDLWNLVYIDKSYNSIKSNHIPTETVINKLEQRNKRLLELVKVNGINDTHTEELELSQKNDLVRKYWIGCKG